MPPALLAGKLLAMQIFYKNDLGFVLKAAKTNVALALNPKQLTDESVIVTVTADAEFKTKKEQTVFDWPGEYEKGGVMTQIFQTGKNEPGRVIKLVVDDISCVHVTSLSEPLTEKEEEEIGKVDILFVPLAGAIPEKEIMPVIEALEPKIVVPMQATPEQAAALAKTFGSVAEPQDSLKIKASDLTGERVEVRILSAA